ncbi:hypothetical protein PV325_008376 [Microctonus aethiopoides]|nr:hypothetical protein PV325_008376 [Microctonus aethiopoides]KAK0095356.1 hypothetical protein PV326_008591 [Microctonus aethiopoides]
MRKWQILEFDGKPYYAFVPENETPIDTDDIPIAENTEEFNLNHDNSTHCKLEVTHEDENNDELMGDDASFYDYEYNDCEVLDDEDFATNDVKPIIMNGVINENDKNTQGDLYQVKVEGSVVTIEKLEENVLKMKDNNDNASNTEEKRANECEYHSDNVEEEREREDIDENEEALENVMIEDEDHQTHQVPQYIDGDSMESQIIEYLSDEREEEEEEEDVDDVEAIEEETLVQVSPSIQSKNQRQSRYRPILPNTSVALKCKACSETFGSALAFRKHVAWTHKKKVCIQEDGAYICAVCDYRTMKKSLFATHLERKHETWPRKGHNSLVFPCAVCGFVCRSKHSLQSHFIRKHTDKYEHQCKFCPKKFKVKGDLTNHVRFHHKEKPINCDVCGKLCQNTGSLYVHQKWAHYKPKFECTICKRRMVTQENLAQHMVTQHEKREKIVCAECGKTFTKKDSFKRHMAVHTGSKPHPCPICNKPFARQSQLRQHVLIHTGKRPFVCDICGKAFTQKPGLICHRKTHPGLHPPLPVMPIADLVKEFTAEYLQESANVIDEVEPASD